MAPRASTSLSVWEPKAQASIPVKLTTRNSCSNNRALELSLISLGCQFAAVKNCHAVQIPNIMQCQLAVTAEGPDGNPLAATGETPQA